MDVKNKGIRPRTRWMRGVIFGFGLAIILLGAALVRFRWGRFTLVPPHTKLTVYQSTNCKIYLMGAAPETIVFSGEGLIHNLSYGAGGIYDVGISGTGRILFKKTIIQVGYDRVSVNNKLLDSRPCSYVVSDDGTVKFGEIRTYN